jgi:hypothetical protein
VSDFESQVPVREGLPSTYRMRADAHYVDLLEGRSAVPLAPWSSERAQESVLQSVDLLDPVLHAGRDLAKALTTLAGCGALLADAPSDLSRMVVGDLIRAEAWRASALLHATRVVRKEMSMARTAVPVSSVLDKVMLAIQPQRRVRPVTIDARSALPYGSVVVGDEPMLAGALSWSLLLSLAVLDGVEDAKMTVSVGTDSKSGVAFAVSQSSVTPPAIWQTRAFDPAWAERPGGVPALVWGLALREVAHANGGSVRVERTDRGTTIGFNLPAGV